MLLCAHRSHKDQRRLVCSCKLKLTPEIPVAVIVQYGLQSWDTHGGVAADKGRSDYHGRDYSSEQQISEILDTLQRMIQVITPHGL